MSTLPKPESFYETSLASAITASQATIPVVSAPNETVGYLVLEANTANREIVKYTGVTGTTLTGVTRGLAESGSDDSAGTGKAHSAGTDIANRDVHYYYTKYYDFLTGTSATGSNTMIIGDGNAVSAADRFWYAYTDTVSAFWGLNTAGQMVVSEDGVTSYVISAGGSGVAGSNSIDITAGVASVKSISAAALYLSSSGLRVSSGKLAVNTGQGLSATSASELYVDLTHDFSWIGTHTFNVIPKLSETTPTSGAHAIRKTYVDDLSRFQGYSRNLEFISAMTSGVIYTVKTLSSMPAPGDYSTVVINGHIKTNISSGTLTYYLTISDAGGSSDVLAYAQSSGYASGWFETRIMDRGASSVPYYVTRFLWDSGASTDYFGNAGSVSMNLSAGFNIAVRVSSSTHSGRNVSCAFLDAQYIKV
jgi:hypothetical protein